MRTPTVALALVITVTAVTTIVTGRPAADGQRTLDRLRPFETYGHIYDPDNVEAMRPRVMGKVNSTGRRNTSMMRCCDAETETETVRPGGSACDAFAWSAAGNGACGAATVLEGDRAGAVE